MKTYILERLREPSTWRGLVLLLTSAGVTITPALGEVIVSLGLAVAGAIGVFVPDSK